jgi:hypothetical protein
MTDTIRPQRTIAAEIASTAQARHNCENSGNTEWEARHDARLTYIERNILPSGSGIDNGTRIDTGKCRPTTLVLRADYHKMNENGYYTGWVSFKVTVRAKFESIDVNVTGRNVDSDLREYLADTYHHALLETFAGYPADL